jgi:hypothetical protein
VGMLKYAQQVGKVAVLRVDGFRVHVRLLDARLHWGRIDYLVTPVDGDGERWVSAERLLIQEGS